MKKNNLEIKDQHKNMRKKRIYTEKQKHGVYMLEF